MFIWSGNLHQRLILKGAYSEILEIEFSLNFKIWSLFKPIQHPWWKKCTVLSPLKSNKRKRKQCLCYLLFYKMVETHFLIISQRVFHWFYPNYREFVHETSHIQPSKYDSTSGTKISICLKKIGGWGCGSEQAPLTKLYLLEYLKLHLYITQLVFVVMELHSLSEKLA